MQKNQKLQNLILLKIFNTFKNLFILIIKNKTNLLFFKIQSIQKNQK